MFSLTNWHSSGQEVYFCGSTSSIDVFKQKLSSEPYPKPD
jgi:hypothetical protein